MKYKDLSGKIYIEDNTQDKLLRKLYESKWGRMLLKPLVQPAVSKVAGMFLDTGFSKCLIQPFIRKCHLDMSPYIEQEYRSYNDFFTRPIKPEERMIDYHEMHLISPSDGKVSVYSLENGTEFEIKHTRYTAESILKNKKLAARYKNGYAVIIRLSVDNYHRYCYPAAGRKSRNYFIPGVFHTVNPAACERLPVYKENSREYTVIQTEDFGTIVQMEVGALMVGRICNYHESGLVEKGQEKGKFEFGGSTILLLLEEDKVRLKKSFLENTNEGYETLIQMGQCIGYSAKKIREF